MKPPRCMRPQCGATWSPFQIGPVKFVGCYHDECPLRSREKANDDELNNSSSSSGDAA